MTETACQRATKCVAPARERGLKSILGSNVAFRPCVAPARERGLKFPTSNSPGARICRSRKGAWIEMKELRKNGERVPGRSRKGAWIEISVRAEFGNDPRVAPARERGLKFPS